MKGEMNLLNNSEVQKSWPSGVDMKMDEDLELLSLFSGEPAVDRATKTLKQNRLTKALEEPKKGSLTKCASAFQFTLNEIEKWNDMKLYITGHKNFQYAIACKEFAPETGHPHIHCYLQLTRSTRLSLKKLQHAHVEKCYGSPQENLDYIYKRGKYASKKHRPDDVADIIFEQGELHEKGGCQTIKELKEAPEEELDDNPIIYYNIVNKEKERRKSIITPETFYSPKQIFYIHGESGSGKTVFVTWLMEKFNINNFENIKREENFYHGVKGICSTALYDDFRDSHMRPSEFINLIDYNQHTMNIKGGSVNNLYKNIFITSVFSPRDLWSNIEKRDESSVQWLRRINYCIYIDTEHNAYLQDSKTGRTIREYKSFKPYVDELKRKKEAEEKVKTLMDELE